VPDWDEDSPQLRRNLAQVLEEIARGTERHVIPTADSARRWQRLFLQNLEVPHADNVGAFRGEAGLENVRVRVDANYGVPAAEVAGELKRFEVTLQQLVAELDSLVPAGHEPDADQLAAIIDVCAWAHAEWVRIHPFSNGNGRTGRLWANFIALRYGLPPFIRLRPRPNAGYAEAGTKAMQGNWKPTVTLFHQLLKDFLSDV
jgi:hypothetical protein